MQKHYSDALTSYDIYSYQAMSDRSANRPKGVWKVGNIFRVAEQERSEQRKEKWTKISGVGRRDTSRHARNSFDFPFTGPKRTSGTSGRQCIKDSSDIGNRSKLLFPNPHLCVATAIHDFPPTSTCSFHPSIPTTTPSPILCPFFCCCF